MMLAMDVNRLRLYSLEFRRLGGDLIEIEFGGRCLQVKGMAGKWEAFNNEIIRVQKQYVPARARLVDEEVQDILKHIKVDKSLGPDQVYPREVIAGPPAETFVSSIAIDELDVNIGGMISKFADDTKIGGVVDSEEAYLRVQWDLDQMGHWAKEWQTKFNLDKCE
eukprot:g42258.t1